MKLLLSWKVQELKRRWWSWVIGGGSKQQEGPTGRPGHLARPGKTCQAA